MKTLYDVQQLLKHFKTIKAIKAASLEQLQEVVPKNTAQAVYGYFHQENREKDSV